MLKRKLTQSLIDQMDAGRFLITQAESVATLTDLDQLVANYDRWDEINKHILQTGFTQAYQQFFRMYSSQNYLGSVNLDINSFEAKRERLLKGIPFQLNHLQIALNSLEQLPSKAVLPIEPLQQTIFNRVNENTMKKIFISHSSLDAKIVQPLIDIIETIGVKPEEIFFSSHPDYGIGLGEDILIRLKKELSSEVLVLFVLSDNFYNSSVCLCEMGATWIMTNQHIPILIPPFDFNKVKGVFPNSLGMKINEVPQLNKLKERLEKDFNLAPITNNRWEEKRAKYLSEMQVHIDKVILNVKEKEVLSKINAAVDGRIKRSELKEILGHEPNNPQILGSTTLKQVYLNMDYFQLVD